MFYSIWQRGRQLAAFSHDIAMTALALFICFAIRFDATTFPFWYPRLLTLLLIFLPFAALTYWFFGLYRGVWRFASIPDLVNILKSVAVITTALALADYLTRGTVIVPRSIVFTYPFVQIFLLGALRVAYRRFRDWRTAQRAGVSHGQGIPALILGSGRDAELIIRSIEMDPENTFRAVGLLSQKRRHTGQRIRNIPVLGGFGDMELVVSTLRQKKMAPQRIIVSHEAFDKEGLLEIAIGVAERLDIPVSKLQAPTQSLVDANQPLKLRPLRIEDLLGRSSHTLDFPMVEGMLSGQRVLVTGGGGTIGLELSRQAITLGASKLMVVDFGEYNLYAALNELRELAPGKDIDGRLCDVRLPDRLEAVFHEFKPDLIFHAAALKHVPMMEAHLVEAAATNIVGTKNVSDLAIDVGAKAMVMISTDKAVVPTSVVGATKRCAELLCEAKDKTIQGQSKGDRPRFVSVRFGNVLGSSGSVVPLFLSQIENGGPVTVTHPDMERYFMTVNEAVSLVLMASAHALDHDTDPISLYALDMGEPQKIMDLAERVIKLSGLVPGRDIKIEISGMRPGEKLREELFDSRDRLEETPLDGILAANPASAEPETVNAAFLHIVERISANDPDGLRTAIETIVPEYGDARPVAEAAQ